MFECVCVCVYVYVCMCVCVCACKLMYIYTYICIDKYMYIYIFICIYKSFLCGLWLICVTCPTHTCDTTHLHVCYDSFIRVTYLIYVCDIHRSNATTVCNINRYPVRMCVTYIVQMPRPRPEGRHLYIYIYTPHLCVWHTSFKSMPRLIHMQDKALSCATSLIYRCAKTHL